MYWNKKVWISFLLVRTQISDEQTPLNLGWAYFFKYGLNFPNNTLFSSNLFFILFWFVLDTEPSISPVNWDKCSNSIHGKSSFEFVGSYFWDLFEMTVLICSAFQSSWNSLNRNLGTLMLYLSKRVFYAQLRTESRNLCIHCHTGLLQLSQLVRYRV